MIVPIIFAIFVLQAHLWRMVVTEFEDLNQNWGPHTYEEDSENNRPLSLVVIRKNYTQSRPVPSVEHGNPPADKAQNNQGRKPTDCDVATLTCCTVPVLSAGYECPLRHGCTMANNEICSAKNLLEVIQKFQNHYGQ
ncbi:unnamed protein product [Arctia plantaginis]|uniref:Uncharacterized protein n=1 Tax=Arctia plantaginis TaxID=874455 RepID=A0A8S0ZX23_ARCPL|nr:unnamed protein product [Arctia plantaginis]